MKKLIIILLILGSFFLACNTNPNIVYAETSSVQEELQENIDSQLNNIDFSGLDEIILDLTSEIDLLFGSNSFRDKLTEILNGEFNGGFAEIFSFILAALFNILLKFLPLLASILAIAVIGSILQSLKGGFAGKSTGEVINFVLIGIIVILCANALKEIVVLTTNTINLIKTQMEIIFPILLTLMSAMGGTVAVKVYQPAVAVLCSLIVQIFSGLILPLFTASSIFNIVGNISNGIKLNKFVDFFNSLSKWVIGLSFTIFIAFLSLQGLTASIFDGISIRTAKFAVKNYIPILGGYLSDGFDLILSSSMLIKNSVGVAGLVLLICCILVPILTIAVFGFGLKLVSAIIEPICDNKVSNLIASISKSLSMLVASILAVSFMYFLTIGLIICTSNVVL